MITYGARRDARRDRPPRHRAAAPRPRRDGRAARRGRRLRRAGHRQADRRPRPGLHRSARRRATSPATSCGDAIGRGLEPGHHRARALPRRRCAAPAGRRSCARVVRPRRARSGGRADELRADATRGRRARSSRATAARASSPSTCARAPTARRPARGSRRRSTACPACSSAAARSPGPVVGDQVSEDLAKAELLAFPLLFLLTLIVFRGAIAALLPLFVGLLTIMTTFLGLRLFNEATALSIFALNLAIGLGLGLAIDYSLFVLSRYREEMERDGPGREALDAHAAHGRPDRRLQLADGRRGDALAARLPAALPVLDGDQRLAHRARRRAHRARSRCRRCSCCSARASTRSRPKRWRHREVVTERGFWYRLSHGVMRRPLIVAVTTVGGPDRGRASRSRGSSSPASTRACCPTAPSAKQVDTALRTEFPPGRASPLHVAVERAARARGGELRAYAQRLRARSTASPPSSRRASSATARGSSRVVPDGAALDKRALDLVRAVRAGPAPGRRCASPASRRASSISAPGSADRLPLAIAVLAITTLLILFVDDGLGRAAVQGAAHERARPQRRVRRARAHLPGRPPGGAARLHEPGRAGDHAAARAAGDRRSG